jgi:ornithine cyclodeaminase/alanine dehydrogenase-like protein (mu-crystallin family)
VSRDPATIRYLDAESVRRALPAPAELVELGELALRSLVGGAVVPPKAALEAGPGDLFAHAMPARLVLAEVPGGGAGADLLGVKWISGSPRNRAQGLPALAALIVLNDPSTGTPRAILDGDVITAARTSALSGVAIRMLAPPRHGQHPARAALVGAGVQGRAHAEILAALLPGVAIAVHDRHPERAEALARIAGALPGVGAARAVRDPADAIREAQVVVTATSLASSHPVLGPEDVGPEALLLPVDYGAYVRPELVASAGTFVVDDRERFEANRRSGRLGGWPDPSGVLGELLLAPASRPAGPAVALHQGPGIADVIVADAVLRRATQLGLGVELPR